MNSQTLASPIDRYIAIDIHKHYVLLGGMNSQREWVLRTRKVRMSRFPEWVLKNLRSTDAVVIESTSNAWEIYDLIAPIVAKAVVANPLKVGQISGAKVKTDRVFCRLNGTPIKDFRSSWKQICTIAEIDDFRLDLSDDHSPDEETCQETQGKHAADAAFRRESLC